MRRQEHDTDINKDLLIIDPVELLEIFNQHYVRDSGGVIFVSSNAKVEFSLPSHPLERTDLRMIGTPLVLPWC